MDFSLSNCQMSTQTATTPRALVGESMAHIRECRDGILRCDNKVFMAAPLVADLYSPGTRPESGRPGRGGAVHGHRTPNIGKLSADFHPHSALDYRASTHHSKLLTNTSLCAGLLDIRQGPFFQTAQCLAADIELHCNVSGMGADVNNALGRISGPSGLTST